MEERAVLSISTLSDFAFESSIIAVCAPIELNR